MNFKNKLVNFIVVSVVIITSGCSSPTYSKLNYSYNGAIENARIDNKEFAAKINNQIAEIYGSQAAVDVISDHFNILVVGQVESDGVADGIKFLIKSYPVVKSYISYATISSPPVLLTQEQVNKKVLDRIAAEDNLNQDNIQAVTIVGTVYIIGQISKYEAPNLKSIEEGLYSIPGVYKVNNLIKVMPYTNTL